MQYSSEKCHVRGNKEDGFKYNCNHKGFTTIPTDFDSSTIGISMASNMLTFIQNEAFSYLPRLQRLDLSYNSISYIRPSAFKNCTSLTFLNIDGNSLNCSSSSVPIEVFIDLRRIKELRRIKNKLCRDNAFLRAVCGHLLDMTIYRTDLFNGTHFPAYCNNLKSLRTLQFNVIEPMKLKNTTLQGLERLSIREIYFDGRTFILHPIEADFLKPVENAKIVFISYESRKANVSYALRTMIYPYRNKSMESLELATIRDSAVVELKDEDFQILKTICVKKISLTDDHIIEPNLNRMVGSTLWSCLEDVDISGNMFHRLDNFFAFLFSLPRVRKINMCCQYIVRANSLTSSKFLGNESKSETTTKYGIHLHNVSIILYFPDSMEWFSFAHIDWRNNLFDYDLKFNAKNLKFLDASYILLDSCSGRILGMPALSTLRIQMWNCESVNPEFISHLTSVTNLTFSSLNLGENVQTKPLLQNLFRLHTLNISDNKITDLKHDFFRSQGNSLKRLDISFNKLHFLPATMMALNRIQWLDLRFNKLTSFSQREMLFLEKENLLIKLEGNSLECSCGSVSILRWMKSNQEKVQDFDILKCIDDNGILRNLTEIVTNLRHIELSCVSKVWLYLSVSEMIVFILLLIISTILYKFRADVRYVYARLRRHIRRNQKYVQLIEKYHAFLSYESSNYEWPAHTLLDTLEAKGFRLCVPDRDFTPGTDEVDNIIDSIDNSKRMIFVLTRDFLGNDWCEWQIQMARIHAFRNDNENFIIVIIKDDLKSHEIPKSLKKIWIRVNCLRWPLDDDQNLIEEFWQKLEDSLSAD